MTYALLYCCSLFKLSLEIGHSTSIFSLLGHLTSSVFNTCSKACKQVLGRDNLNSNCIDSDLTYCIWADRQFLLYWSPIGLGTTPSCPQVFLYFWQLRGKQRSTASLVLVYAIHTYIHIIWSWSCPGRLLFRYRMSWEGNVIIRHMLSLPADATSLHPSHFCTF